MAVKGKLKERGLATALQAVATHQQPCVILASCPAGRFELHCKEGKVVRAAAQGADPDDRLAEALVRSGAAHRHDVQDARVAARQSNEGLPAAMAARMDREELRMLLRVQIVDVVLELFASHRGTWEIDSERTPLRWGFDAVDARELIEDGHRAVDEWPVVRSVVDSSRLRFKKIKDLDSSANAGAMSPNDHRVFTLVRDDRDVGDIEHLARLGRFEAERALYQLASEGYIVAKGLSPEVEGPITKAAARQARRSRLVHALGHLAVLALLAVTGLYGARKALRPPPSSVSGSVADIDSDLQAVLGANQRARIRAAIEVYSLHRGGYPDDLETVVAAGLLSPDDLTYPLYAEPYVLQRVGERSFSLTPPLR